MSWSPSTSFSTRFPRSASHLFIILGGFCITIGCVLTGLPRAYAQKPEPTEYEVKAAYLYNFGRFVAWPDQGSRKDEPFEICVLGQDPFGPALDATVSGETIEGENVAAKRIEKPQEIDSCRILFISSSEDSRLDKILEALDKSRVLTVSDIPQFSQRGGMIQFVSERNRIRFEVNLTNAENAGLNLSSELLKVAIRVQKNPSGN
jgi:YfiR/HmsC-like